MKIKTPDTVSVSSLDLLDAACLCHAALAQDSPEPPSFYIGQILALVMGPLPMSLRPEIETYLAEKKYLGPAPKIEIAQ